MRCAGWEWLPGELTIVRGTRADYQELERFHYVGKKPAVWAGVWRVIYRDELRQCSIDNCQFSIANSAHARLVAVGVMSYPVPSCTLREEVLGISRARYERKKIRWLNENLRTISRVIVHPQFRGVGLASALVRTMCDEAPTRYVEAMAVMGRAVPFFERAGMRRHQPTPAGGPVYFLWDRDLKS